MILPAFDTQCIPAEHIHVRCNTLQQRMHARRAVACCWRQVPSNAGRSIPRSSHLECAGSCRGSCSIHHLRQVVSAHKVQHRHHKIDPQCCKQPGREVGACIPQQPPCKRCSQGNKQLRGKVWPAAAQQCGDCLRPQLCKQGCCTGLSQLVQLCCSGLWSLSCPGIANALQALGLDSTHELINCTGGRTEGTTTGAVLKGRVVPALLKGWSLHCMHIPPSMRSSRC